MPTATWERLPEARRQAVLAAAEAEFALRGFSGGSLNVIARNAGVAKGSLFQYFTDKVDLYTHLSELASRRIRAYMETRIAELPWVDGFFPAFGELMLEWIEYFRTHDIERAVTAAVNLEPDAAARSAVRTVANRHYVEVLRPMLEQARDAGAVRADADLDAFLALLILLLPHLALAPHIPGLDPVFGLADGLPEQSEAAVRRLLAVLRAAFGSEGRAGS
ncbi:MAG TPA: TetR/AcrR family transcriptional regulator [Mycobacteriales bacterium]|nr:TetR/AcrR family transcriptional regulator [Mycobacteriales bacterium]